MKSMRNFDKQLAGALVVLALAGHTRAQTADPAAEPSSDARTASVAAPAFRTAVEARYAALQEQDQLVLNSPASIEGDFRLVVDRYWSFVRRYPTSGYTDNALWQAANLASESFRRFGQDRDKQRAVQLLQWLRDQYPHSRLRAGASTQLASIDAMPGGASTLPPDQIQTIDSSSDASSPVSVSSGFTPAAAPAPAATASVSTAPVTIRGIQREVMNEVVRITVELEHEVPFYQERIEGPARLFFDLKGTKAVPSLVDATFRYPSDVVRHIRLGRHPNNTTRIVLDLENVSQYSIFTLYNPYRIVIDAERAEPKLLASRTIKGADTRIVSIAPRAAIAPPMVVTSKALAAPKAATALRMPPPAPKPVPTGMRVATSRSIPMVLSTAPALVTARLAVLPSPSPAVPPPAAPAQTASLDVETEDTVTVDKPVLPARPVSPSRNASGKFSVARQLGLGVSRIVIDAGHGGHDPGAMANGISEAELVLDIAQRLEALLSQQEGIEVVLTRRTNEFIPLDERTEIANREAADLFLSIHANASANRTARGVETYFLNFALNPQAEAVAARENAASGKTMNSLPGIIKAITLNNKLSESRDFASSIQRSLVRGMRPGNKLIRDLGVKQAPFVVLIGAAMPSVLAEISFVTNKQEARLLKTPAYRQRIAESLLSGILRYQDSLKKVQTAALQ
jgi:N-acetylmuramoyl-L-alanine amidase